MQANWSLILNVLMLVGVIVAIGRLMNTRRQAMGSERFQPSVGRAENSPYDAQPFNDDIIAVRKVSIDESPEYEEEYEPEPQLLKQSASAPAQPKLMPEEPAPQVEEKTASPVNLMMFLLAKENRQFAGYELLQTVLAAGLRFGEGSLFHRHQFSNGQGPVICSLAAATASGVFDLQNIGAFSVRGLCLFMQPSKNPTIDAERFAIMLDTAKQLSEGMDAYLLDDQRKPLNNERINRYKRILNIEQCEEEFA